MLRLSVLLGAVLLSSCHHLPSLSSTKAASKVQNPRSNENEIKLTLDRENFHKVLSLLTKAATAKQRNNYLDTEAFDLRTAGLSLRIREKYKSPAILTLKIDLPRHKTEGALFSRGEYECQITDNALVSDLVAARASAEELSTKNCHSLGQGQNHPITQLAKHLKIKADQVSLSQIKSRVQNETQRTSSTVVIDGHAYSFELDRTAYPRGFVGYELEVELGGEPSKIDHDKRKILDFLIAQSVLFQPSKYSKAELTHLMAFGEKDVRDSLVYSGMIQGHLPL